MLCKKPAGLHKHYEVEHHQYHTGSGTEKRADDYAELIRGIAIRRPDIFTTV